MFERYSERSRRVIFFARYEALQYGSQVIAPEHLLLGLMREDKTVGARFFPYRRSISVDTIRRDVEERISVRERIPQSAELHLSPEAKKVLFWASEESRHLKSTKIRPEHLLAGMLREEKTVAAEILFKYGVRVEDVREEISRQTTKPKPAATATAQGQPGEQKQAGLAEYTRDLTAEAEQGKLDPLVGRGPETERLIEILCRRTKNNPVLIGESGVGKTAIIEGLAQRVVDRTVPTFLENKKILSLDLSALAAGTKYRGQFEERLKKVMAEVRQEPDVIIFS
ncbi:MAG TPA: Clp protease N-terminal domain-containing protein, partial [Pyrinomonadaceae bacterium]|nr:Clp protease N-terminal domain-containing protein [Pyrinomonadaceae bacterium]